MKCKKCGGKGYIESWHAGSAAWTASVKQCSERCNITGYSEHVQKILGRQNLSVGYKAEDSGVVIEPAKNNVVSLFNGA